MIGLPKLKSEANVPAFDPLQNEQIRPVAETSKPALPKNETPHRFWAFVEPYCAPITHDDISVSFFCSSWNLVVALGCRSSSWTKVTKQRLGT